MKCDCGELLTMSHLFCCRLLDDLFTVGRVLHDTFTVEDLATIFGVVKGMHQKVARHHVNDINRRRPVKLYDDFITRALGAVCILTCL